MSGERTTYRFGPLERHGLLGSVRIGQALIVAGGALAAVVILNTLATSTGIFIAVGALGASVALAAVPIAGRTSEEWLPIALVYALRGLAGGRDHHARPPAHDLELTSGRIRPGRSDPLSDLPRALHGVRLREQTHRGRSVGLISDHHGRHLTVVLACRVVAFPLLDPEAQERRLARWGGVLATAASTPIRRLQWIERTAPAQGDALARWLHSARDPELPARGVPIVESYLELISASTRVTQDHEILLAVQIDAARTRARRGERPEQIAIDQSDRVARMLEESEIEVLGALNGGQLARMLRTAFDPYARAELSPLDAVNGTGHGSSSSSAGPSGSRESWESYRCDGAHHATYWVGGWPHSDVPPMFMDAILGSSDVVRTVSVSFEPVPPERSAREAEAAITRDRADSELRRRFGQSETARQRVAREAAMRRESELAAGHGEVRLAGFITVSGRDPVDLERSCAEVVQQAARARLELHRMYGQQAEAFTFTLPLARGLR